MRWEGRVVRMGAKRNAYRILVGKPEGKRSVGRPRRGWVDSIKMDLTERLDWYGLNLCISEGRSVEGSCEHGNEPSGSIKCWEVLG
jgi:hypothetical protein